jgi:hypothetical protein
MFDLDISNEHSTYPIPQAEDLIFEETLPGGQYNKEDDIPDILQAFEMNGFNKFIPFSELKFDLKTDFLASGGYGDVFRGVWEGAQIAIKRFSKR